MEKVGWLFRFLNFALNMEVIIVSGPGRRENGSAMTPFNSSLKITIEAADSLWAFGGPLFVESNI